MRGLAIGIALAAILFIATGGHFLLIPLLIPLGFFAFSKNRMARRPRASTNPSKATGPGAAG